MNSKSVLASAVLVLCGLGSASALAAENPQDQVGVQHNMYLNCLLDGGVSDTQILPYLVEKCGYNPGMPLEQYIKTNQPLLELDPTTPLTEKLASVRSRYTAYEFSFVERIDRIVATAASPEESAARIAELEAEAIARLDPKSASGKNLLAGLSVARHSHDFWERYAATHDTGTETQRMRWWKWLIVVAVDTGVGLLTEDAGTAGGASNQACNWLNGSPCVGGGKGSGSGGTGASTDTGATRAGGGR